MIEIHLNDLAQVRVHELHDEIHILELFQCALWRERIKQTNDLWRKKTTTLVQWREVLGVCFKWKGTFGGGADLSWLPLETHRIILRFESESNAWIEILHAMEGFRI